MGKVSVQIARTLGVHVANGKHIKLLTAAMTGDVDWEKHGPGDKTSKEAESRCDLEVAQQEVGIHRLMAQDVGIWQAPHGADPAKEAGLWCGSALMLAQCSDVCSGNVLTTLALAQDQKEHHHDSRDDGGGHEGRKKPRQRVGCIAGLLWLFL